MGRGAQPAPSFSPSSSPRAAIPGCTSHGLYPALTSCFLPLLTLFHLPGASFLPPRSAWNMTAVILMRGGGGCSWQAVVSEQWWSCAKLQLASRWPQKNNFSREVKENHHGHHHHYHNYLLRTCHGPVTVARVSSTWPYLILTRP